MTTAQNDLPAIPNALTDVAMINAKTAAAAGSMSISQFLELVRIKDAPQPVIRQPRFTRWNLMAVRAWLIERASQHTADTRAAEMVTARARKASDAAKAKRGPVAADE